MWEMIKQLLHQNLSIAGIQTNIHVGSYSSKKCIDYVEKMTKHWTSLFYIIRTLLFWIEHFWGQALNCRTPETVLTLVLLNKLRCHALSKFSTNQINWSRLLIWIHIVNGKQCRSRSVGFFRSQLIWIYTVCKGSIYPGSAGQGLKWNVF